MSKFALVFGGGKIARGFIGQILFLNGYNIEFADINTHLVDLLNTSDKYQVHIMGNEKRNSLITNFSAISITNLNELYRCFYESDVVFVSVGGANLGTVGETIGKMFQQNGIKNIYQNIVVCENWLNAGKVLEKSITSNLSYDNVLLFNQYIGICEAVVMRTATQPNDLSKKFPLDVWVQDYWNLPVDNSKIKGRFPDINYIELRADFNNLLTQKLFTNNTSNAVIAYSGFLLGYEYIADAANSPEIQLLLDQAYPCINKILEKEIGVDPEEQRKFSEKARAKYCDYTIVDKVIRHAKDPIRKLGPNDRLIAPCRIALQQHIDAAVLVDTIAKAIFFDEPSDESAMKLKKIREKYGIEYVLKNICKLCSDEPLYNLVLESVEKIRKMGLVIDHE